MSISVHQWLNIVFRSWFSSISWFTLFFHKSLVWRHESFDKAHDQGHPASCSKRCLKRRVLLTSPWRAYALRLWLSAQTPQLRFGNILSMVNLLFGASQTYVARRAYSEQGERCSKSSCLLLFSFWTGFQDLQDWRRIVSRPFDAACSVCTRDAKPPRKRD